MAQVISASTPLSRSIEITPGLYVSPLAGIAIVCAVAFFCALHLFLSRTNVGAALRALAENPELVRTYGLSPRRLSTYAFALGSLLVVPSALLTGASSGLGFLINDNDDPGTDVQNYLVWPATYGNFNPVEDAAIAVLE